jgi:hypothetical protein
MAHFRWQMPLCANQKRRENFDVTNIAVLLIGRHLRASKNGIIDSRADRITGVPGAVSH